MARRHGPHLRARFWSTPGGLACGGFSLAEASAGKAEQSPGL